MVLEEVVVIALEKVVVVVAYDELGVGGDWWETGLVCSVIGKFQAVRLCNKTDTLLCAQTQKFLAHLDTRREKI